MHLTVKYAELTNGVTLPYVEQGDPSGTPVVFLHGVTDSWHSFERVLGFLPKSIHAFALSQRGHGDASGSATSYRTRDFAEDLLAFLNKVNLQSAIIVGHSMGTANAVRFAIDYPERTLGLVLICFFATFKRNPLVVDFWRTAVSELTDPIDPEFVREFQLGTLAAPLPKEFLDTVVRESLKLKAAVWQGAFQGLLEDDFAEELDGIKAPSLLLWGSNDVYCPEIDQKSFLAKVSGSQLKRYQGAGHGVHWEEPQTCAKDIVSFCSEVKGK